MPEIKSDNISELEGETKTEITKDNSMNLIEQLRGKTEEGDLDQYLKKRFGGYTKQSVLEYFGNIRKQQQASATTFYRNMQILYDEKEALKKSNEALQLRLSKVESDYENLSESILLNKLESEDFCLQDIIDLKSNITALEEEQKGSNDEIKSLKNKMDHMDYLNQDLLKKLEQSNQELIAQKQLVVSEKLETKKQRDIASDLFSQLEAERDQNKYLKEIITKGEAAKLKAKISDLTEQLASLSEVNEKLISENKMKDQANETLNNQIESLKQRTDSLSKTIEELNVQNDKLLFSNNSLTNQLEEEYKKAIALVRERSDITMEKLIIMRKLDDANMRISILEQQLNKEKKAEELSTVYRNVNKLEEESDK